MTEKVLLWNSSQTLEGAEAQKRFAEEYLADHNDANIDKYDEVRLVTRESNLHGKWYEVYLVQLNWTPDPNEPQRRNP